MGVSLPLARDLGYVADRTYDEMTDRNDRVGTMLNGLIKSLKSRAGG